MKIVCIAVALTLSFAAAPAWAKKFAFPTNDPAATVTIPDTWKTKSIKYGFQAKSPDGDIFFSVESAPATSMNKMLDENAEWMKENKIAVTAKAAEREVDLGGLKGKMLVSPAKDENGETQLILIFAEAGQRLIFVTLWASVEEQKANDKDINTIMGSIKTID